MGFKVRPACGRRARMKKRKWVDLLFDEPDPLSIASLPVASMASTMAEGGTDDISGKG